MVGTKAGGLKTAEHIKKFYGEDFYRRIGQKGGRNSKNGGFASKEVGADGLTGIQRAKIAGTKGGRISKRGPAKPKVDYTTPETAEKSASKIKAIVKRWRQLVEGA